MTRRYFQCDSCHEVCHDGALVLFPGDRCLMCGKGALHEIDVHRVAVVSGRALDPPRIIEGVAVDGRTGSIVAKLFGKWYAAPALRFVRIEDVLRVTQVELGDASTDLGL